MNTDPIESQPIFCDLTAIPASDRKQHLLGYSNIRTVERDENELIETVIDKTAANVLQDHAVGLCPKG